MYHPLETAEDTSTNTSCKTQLQLKALCTNKIYLGVQATRVLHLADTQTNMLQNLPIGAITTKSCHNSATGKLNQLMNCTVNCSKQQKRLAATNKTSVANNVIINKTKKDVTVQCVKMYINYMCNKFCGNAWWLICLYFMCKSKTSFQSFWGNMLSFMILWWCGLTVNSLLYEYIWKHMNYLFIWWFCCRPQIPWPILPEHRLTC